MPGQKFKHVIKRKLEFRAKKLDLTLAEYLHDWVAEPKTIRQLAEEVGCSAPQMSRLINEDESLKEAVRLGRMQGADNMAEDSLALMDELAEREVLTTQDVQLAKERVSVRKWLAAVSAPDKFAPKQQVGSVTMNIGELHLEALKKVRSDVIDAVDVTPRLADGD